MYGPATILLQRHFIDEHFITFMKKARKGDFPDLFHMVRKESGKGGPVIVSGWQKGEKRLFTVRWQIKRPPGGRPLETSPSGSPLDETADVVDAFAGQEQDGRHIDQRIRTGTPGLGKAHGGAGAGHEDLSGQSRVVDAHVEREMLVGR